MGLTGVIYAVIVVGWAVFLVPLALRRHDQAARNHSIERFSSAMRVLSRRRAEDGRVVVTPPRSSDRVMSPSLTPARDVEPRLPSARPTRASLQEAAARRRRVLVILLLITAGTGAASAFAVVPWWSAAIPVALIITFLSVARRQVRLANEHYWQEAADARPEPSNVVRRPAVRVDASHGARRRDDDEPTVTLTREQIALAASALEEEIVEVVALATADGSSLWDPLPITLPTYVDKPAARRTYRTIDLDEQNIWSAGHSTAASQTAAAADADAVADPTGAVESEAAEDAARAAGA